jgi:hypothetical protein
MKHGYITMTHRQSNNQWSDSIVAHSTPKILSAQIRWESSHLVFWDQDGILLIDYLPKDQTVNVEYYASLLVKFKDILQEKHCRKVHDNVLAHQALATQKILGVPGLPTS